MAERAMILIIEDDEDTVEAMKITLEAENYRVLSAFNPDEGLKMAKDERPDLIILDVMFGKKEKSKGFDYAIKMKQERALAPVPILMVTAINVRRPEFGFSTETDGEFLPVDDFIDKPAQPEDLVGKVKKLLALKTSRWVNWPNQTPQ